MYCRMCGNLLSDTDRFCKKCGTKIDLKPSADSAEPIGEKEEVVFNPPYEEKAPHHNRFYFVEEESSEKRKQKEKLKGFTSGNEREENKWKEDKSDREHSGRNDEFNWNVHEFPKEKEKETEEAVFNWELKEFDQPGSKEATETASEEEIFREIMGDANALKGSNIDRFFTFSKKNEEFQKLLDREYEKHNRHSEQITKLITEADTSVETDKMDQFETGADLKANEGSDTTIASSVREKQVPEETICQAEKVEISVPKIEMDVEPSVEKIAQESEESEQNASKSEQLSEMTQARKLFFGDTMIKDNEAIIKDMVSAESDAMKNGDFDVEQNAQASAEHSLGKTVVDYSPEEDQQAASGGISEAFETPENSEISEPFTEREMVEDSVKEEEEPREKGRKKQRFGQILLIIIAVILVAEIAILGILSAPESTAAKAIEKTQTKIARVMVGWKDGINNLISGKDSKEEKNSDQGDAKQQEGTDIKEPEDDEKTPTPDSTPMEDKAALVASQLSNNTNIEQVKANETLSFADGKDYGLTDLNNSKPIANNIWVTPEGGTTVYYDQSIVGTVIAFDSQWIDYVNGNDDSVLNLLKKDSEAYKNSVGFSKVGKVKETFKTLEIGEIRQGAEGFYLWAHEEIQITEKGVTTDKNYNWIYYLEPVEGKMNIVNYFNFK